jgi:hypothetical protein
MKMMLQVRSIGRFRICISMKNLFLFLFLLADLAYSAFLYYHFPMDGDLVNIVRPLPGETYFEVLRDPFAVQVLQEGLSYANPNRFFAHISLSAWFHWAPFVWQWVSDPVSSIYLAAASAKTIFHFLLVYALAILISGRLKLWGKQVLLAACLITPLLQTFGLNRHMGLIDQSVTYSFFYALPTGLLLLFLSPWFRRYLHGTDRPLTGWEIGLLALLIPVLALSCPLIPGVVIVLFPMAVWGLRRQQVSIHWWFLAGGLLLFSIYSLYIGSFNFESEQAALSLGERYSRMPTGLYYKFTTKIGFPLLFALILSNIFLMARGTFSVQQQRIFSFLKWGLLFSVLYLTLLPFGGYRDYRENIIRYDTILPVTLFIFLAYGLTTHFLIRRFRGRARVIYSSVIALCLFVFLAPDRLRPEKYLCERKALEEIASSPDPIVPIGADCTVMSWVLVKDPAASEKAGRLLQFWKITEEEKRFFQVE